MEGPKGRTGPVKKKSGAIAEVWEIFKVKKSSFIGHFIHCE